MKGIELTQESNLPIWLPLSSIVSVRPYMGFDNRETGTEIMLTKSAIRVMEDYPTVTKKVQKL